MIMLLFGHRYLFCYISLNRKFATVNGEIEHFQVANI